MSPDHVAPPRAHHLLAGGINDTRGNLRPRSEIRTARKVHPKAASAQFVIPNIAHRSGRAASSLAIDYTRARIDYTYLLPVSDGTVPSLANVKQTITWA